MCKGGEFMFNSKLLDMLSQLDIETLDKSSLVNIKDVNIDNDLPESIRMIQYLEQIQNPYCFMCGTICVKISFSPDGNDFKNILENHFIKLKR